MALLSFLALAAGVALAFVLRATSRETRTRFTAGRQTITWRPDVTRRRGVRVLREEALPVAFTPCVPALRCRGSTASTLARSQTAVTAELGREQRPYTVAARATRRRRDE